VRVVDADITVSGDVTPTEGPTTVATGSPTVPNGATPTVTPTAEATATESPVPTAVAGCPGDCDGNGSVSIDELIRGVGIALGHGAIADCAALDDDHDGSVSIDELVRAVNAALSRCTE
jgi:hypothetical protein